MNKKVIYTAIFGNYDNLIDPVYLPKGWDFICFTDSDLISDIWKIKKVNRLHQDPKRENSLYKLLPHRFLSNYKYSIYVDGNILVRGDVNELQNKFLIDVNIAMMNHNKTATDKRNCVYEEAKAIISMDQQNFKDHPNIVMKQINKYKAEGYPTNNGLICGGEILRKHNEKDVIDTMEFWWRELLNGSKRDQLSFNYSAWKTNLNFKWMDGDVRDNKYFLLTVKHKIKTPSETIISKLKKIIGF